MKTATALLILFLCAPAVHADSSAMGASGEIQLPHQAPQQPQSSENGVFRLELVPEKEGIKVGPNTLEIVLRDQAGKGVEGAQLSVTPWMPTMGHGVWEKPVVKEQGGGSYRVDNVILIMGGLWELRVAIRKGAVEDKGVFSLTVAEAEPPGEEQKQPQTGYDRRLADYQVPNVTLTNQDGKKVKLQALIDSGKPVIVDFIFTTCTTICPILSASFTNLRRDLGDEAQRVQLISITMDPEHDTPEVLKRYSERFGGGPGWELLTGTRDEVETVLRAFDAFVVDKMSHQPLYFLRAPRSTAQWVRIKGVIKKSDLLKEYRGIEH